ncbi:uncharacterized protein [Diadema setosum]|uniref:uncharacterized protein n=1 Tax=Diadema setosum TaxID=31175 RepID=UPI003B3BC485
MDSPTPSRRSQRTNRRLPARFLDDSIEVSTSSPRKPQPLSLVTVTPGKASACKSQGPLQSCQIVSRSAAKVIKSARKVQSKTDIAAWRCSPVDKDKQAAPGKSPQSLECNTCGHAFTRAGSLRRHLLSASCKAKSGESDLEEESKEHAGDDRMWTPNKKPRKVCKICGKSFVDKYTLNVHKRLHTGERPYQCTLCEKNFTQRSALQFHLDTHAGEKHECPICGYKFTQARSLKRHMLFHTGDKVMKRKMVNRNYKKIRVLAADGDKENGSGDGQRDGKERVYVEVYECHYCKKQFKRVSELTVHVRIHTNERPFQCDICEKSFKQLSHLHGHKATHFESQTFVCEDCGKQFTMAKSLRRHQALKICSSENSEAAGFRKRGRPRNPEKKEQVGNSENFIERSDFLGLSETMDEGGERQALRKLEHDGNQREADTGSGEVNACVHCGKTFVEKSDLMQHICKHSENPSFSCSKCGKKFRLASYLKEHMKTHSTEKPYACDNCNKKFKTQRCLQNHAGRNSCTGVRPYVCQTCGKTFMYQRFLTTHRCLNTPVKMFSCGDCGKMYERKDRLIEHLRVHTGERPFACELCGKTFAKIANYRLHQRVHTGEKKYKCKYCGKKFAHNSTLKYHEGTHSERKTLQCDECEKQFVRSKALLTHKQTVHGAEGAASKTSYLCANCGKVYHHLKRLMRHFCEVNGVKRFPCNLCDKQFDRAKQLEIHMRVHTGEKPYECDKCGKSFSQSGGLKDHMLSHTREKRFKCDLCDVKFLRMKSLRKHKLIIHHGIEPHICGQCGATFKYYKALKKHELVHGTVDPEQKVLTDILEDIEQAINEASEEAETGDSAVTEAVNGIAPQDQVAEVVIHEDPGMEVIIGHDEEGNILHVIQNPRQEELDQSVQEIHIQRQIEEQGDDEMVVAVVAAVDHHEEVVSKRIDLKMEGNGNASLKQPPRRMNRRRVRVVPGDADTMLECEKCGKKFVTRGGLSVHVCSGRNSLMKQVQGDGDGQRTCREAGADVSDGTGSDDCDLDYQEPNATQKGQVKKAGRSREKARCDICQETFVNHQVLLVHQRRHTGERPYHECKECGKTFTQLRSLKRHAKFHTGEKEMKKGTLIQFRERRVKVPIDASGKDETLEPLISRAVPYQDMYQCEFCDKRFKTGSQYVVHRRIHTDERPFECKTCGRRFRQRITLLDHETTHRNDKPHECERCGSKFKQARILRKHKNSKICDKRTRIKEQNHEFSQKDVESKSNVKLLSKTEVEEVTQCEEDEVHVSPGEDKSATVSESAKPEVESQPETRKKADSECHDTFICEQCGKIFHKKKNLYQHIKTHTNKKPYTCSQCDKGFRLKSTLREHMETHTVGRPHACQNCQKQFKTKRCLQNHIGRNICTQIRPYTCEVCHKSFMYARYLERHRCLQSAPKEFKCTHCERIFTRRHLLVEHIRTHTGEKPLQCSDCNKTFAKKDLLRRHRLVHSADKKFKCKLCGKKFPLRASLRTHMVVHTSERNFVCRICNKAFKQASSLRTHSKKHNPDKQSESKPAAFLCAHCGKMFRHFRRMLKHYCVAHGGKRIKCRVCQKMFDKKQQLEVHMRIHTGDRPYQCGECGKRFTQSGSLKNHLVSHTGEKLHKCDICDARFSRMTSVRRHKLIIHAGVEPFMCNVCGLTFKYQKALKKHTCLAEHEIKEAVLVEPGVVKIQDMANVPEVDVCESDLEQQELDKILGNIKRAMTGAGIEIKDNVQYQIVVGDNSGELVVSMGGDTSQSQDQIS